MLVDPYVLYLLLVIIERVVYIYIVLRDIFLLLILFRKSYISTGNRRKSRTVNMKRTHVELVNVFSITHCINRDFRITRAYTTLNCWLLLAIDFCAYNTHTHTPGSTYCCKLLLMKHTLLFITFVDYNNINFFIFNNKKYKYTRDRLVTFDNVQDFCIYIEIYSSVYVQSTENPDRVDFIS